MRQQQQQQQQQQCRLAAVASVCWPSADACAAQPCSRQLPSVDLGRTYSALASLVGAIAVRPPEKKRDARARNQGRGGVSTGGEGHQARASARRLQQGYDERNLMMEGGNAHSRARMQPAPPGASASQPGHSRAESILKTRTHSLVDAPTTQRARYVRAATGTDTQPYI
jgi:hypothetical protein